MSTSKHGKAKSSSLQIELDVKAPARTTNTSKPSANGSTDLDESYDVFICQGPSDHQKTDVNEKAGIKAPDGGYGWIILLGSFLLHIIIGGMERSDGIFFLQFQARFHQSAQLTAWPTAITTSLRLLSGPLVAVVTSQYSARTCCFIGSFFHFTGLVLASVTPNFYFLFFSMSLLQGIGRGFLYSPSLIILNMYFDNRRSLAVGLASSGVGIGSFLIVPITQYLFDTYGFFGAFMITAAWTLNSAIAAMLYRPLSRHLKIGYGKLTSVEQNENKALVQMTGSNKIDCVEEQQIDRGTYSQKTSTCLSCCSDCLHTCFPKEKSNYFRQKKRKIFHFYLLKDPAFLLFCISIMLFTAAFKSAFTFVPALVKSNGFSENEASFTVSVAGLADTLGRISTGLAFDSKYLRHRRTLLYNVWVFGLAVVSFILPSIDSFVSFCIVNSVYGILSGAYVAQKSVVLVDILGAENINSSFGMLVCFQGLGSVFGPPLSGAFKDAFGSFTEAFYLGGGFMCLAGILMVCSNFYLCVKNRDNESENNKTI